LCYVRLPRLCCAVHTCSLSAVNLIVSARTATVRRRKIGRHRTFNSSMFVSRSGRWIEASDPLLHNCPGHHIGMGMSFARRLNETLPIGDRIVLVPAGLGGTGFWQTGTWSPPNGDGFVGAVTRVNAAMQLAGDDAVLSGVLWHQGEHDAGDNSQYHSVSTKEYLSYFIPMIQAFRNTSFIPATNPRLPLVVGTLLPQWEHNSTYPGRMMVVSALANINQSLSDAQCARGDGLIGDTVYRSGNDNEIIHFTAASQRIFGRRYFHQYETIIRAQQAVTADVEFAAA